MNSSCILVTGLPSTSLARQVMLSERDLISPTFFPFDLDIFQWVVHGLDSRYINPALMMNLMAGRASARNMTRIGATDLVLAPPSGAKYLALVNQRSVSLGIQNG